MQELIVEVERLVAQDVAASGDDELCADVLEAQRLGELVAVVQSRRLVELEVRKTTDVRWGMPTAQWLAHQARLPIGVTRRRVRVARRLRSLLHEVDAAWADGRLNAEHVAVLHDAANVRIAEEIASRLPELIRHAQRLSFAHWKCLVRNLVCLLDQDGAFDPNDDRERNRAGFRDNPDGDGALAASFDRATYASIKHLVEARADRLFRAEQREKKLTPDLRESSRATLVALALFELLREGAAADPCATDAPVTDATIVFTQDTATDSDTSAEPQRGDGEVRRLGARHEHARSDLTGTCTDVGTRDGFAGSSPLPTHGGGAGDPETGAATDGDVGWRPAASRIDRSVWRAWTLDGLLLPADPAIASMVCDAQVRGLVIDGEGRPLRMGHSVRYATAAQRIALGIRDGGCVFPGCDAPPSWCDAHHVIPVDRFGTTDIEVLALLCRRHHRITHRKGWAMHATGDQWFWWQTPSGDTLWSQRHGLQRAGPAPPAAPPDQLDLTGTERRAVVVAPGATDPWTRLIPDPPPHRPVRFRPRGDTTFRPRTNAPLVEQLRAAMLASRPADDGGGQGRRPATRRWSLEDES